MDRIRTFTAIIYDGKIAMIYNKIIRHLFKQEYIGGIEHCFLGEPSDPENEFIKYKIQV